MKSILETFEKNGFEYRQIKRNDPFAIFQQKDIENNMVVGFEVIKIKQQLERKIKNKTLPAGEYYPSTSEWGINGFSCYTEKQALNKFNQLQKKHNV